MVNKKWLAISYAYVFISVYFIQLAYAGVTFYLESNFKVEMPKTEMVNTSLNALSSVSNYTDIPLMVILVVIIIIILFFTIKSFGAMGNAL